MPFRDLFTEKNKNVPDDPLPELSAFLREHFEKGDSLFLTTRPNGKQVALALAPLSLHKNQYGNEAEDGPATILVEGQKVLTTAEWHQGRSSELSWDSGKPVGRNPFTCGMKGAGKIHFSAVEKAPPFYEAFGLDWWSEADGRTLRTLLNEHGQPESALIWQQHDPGAEKPFRVAPSPELRDFVGTWSRSHCVEGEVVVDPSEGSGFSKEGDEDRSETVVVWEDGVVTVTSNLLFHGQFHDSTIRWDSPAAGTASGGTREASEHFQPYDGPVEVSGAQLAIGGYLFSRDQSVEPE